MSAAGCGEAEQLHAALVMQKTGNTETVKVSGQQGTSYTYSGMTADDILAKLTLEQKICQMIQPAVYKINTDIMAEYDFGSVLSKKRRCLSRRIRMEKPDPRLSACGAVF